MMSLLAGLSVDDITDNTGSGIQDCFKLNERRLLNM